MRELAYTAVRFVDREDKRKREIVPSSMLLSQPGEFVALLAGRGYLWPPSQALRHRIRGAVNRKAIPTYSCDPSARLPRRLLCTARGKLYSEGPILTIFSTLP